MGRTVQISVDCADPDRLATFWAAVLDYRPDPPPGHPSWAEFSAAAAVDPGESWSRIADPDGSGPDLFFHRVAEPKAAKNRWHLDVHVPRGAADDERRLIDREVERVVGLGATRVRGAEDDGGYFVVMQDPEGNEFCID